MSRKDDFEAQRRKMLQDMGEKVPAPAPKPEPKPAKKEEERIVWSAPEPEKKERPRETRPSRPTSSSSTSSASSSSNSSNSGQICWYRLLIMLPILPFLLIGEFLGDSGLHWEHYITQTSADDEDSNGNVVGILPWLFYQLYLYAPNFIITVIFWIPFTIERCYYTVEKYSKCVDVTQGNLIYRCCFMSVLILTFGPLFSRLLNMFIYMWFDAYFFRTNWTSGPKKHY